MLIVDDLDAVLDYINDGQANYFPAVKTIDVYKGQLAEAMQNKLLIKMADPLPAVYVILIDQNPVSQIMQLRADLLIVAGSKTFNKGEKQTAAFTTAGGLSAYIDDNQGWRYKGKDYLVDREQLKISHLLTDDRYTIIAVNLFIKNLK